VGDRHTERLLQSGTTELATLIETVSQIAHQLASPTAYLPVGLPASRRSRQLVVSKQTASYVCSVLIIANFRPGNLFAAGGPQVDGTADGGRDPAGTQLDRALQRQL
jgi:hypothetical protein